MILALADLVRNHHPYEIHNIPGDFFHSNARTYTQMLVPICREVTSVVI